MECGGGGAAAAAYKVSGEFTDVNGNVDRVEFRLRTRTAFLLGRCADIIIILNESKGIISYTGRAPESNGN